MSFEIALRATEVLLALALIQQGIEDLGKTRVLALARIFFSLSLALGQFDGLAGLGLCAVAILHLHKFGGPYNGGSDRLSILAIFCVTGAALTPPGTREIFLGYLALQVVMSYAIAGWVKIVEPDWRSGRALSDVFAFSAYPVSQSLRHLAGHPRLMLSASWAVMLLELSLPAALFFGPLFQVVLVLTAAFHLANACLFGLNRFFWVWVSTYPALLWLQGRIAEI